MPEKSCRVNGIAMAHDGAGFSPYHVGDKTQGFGWNIGGGAWGGDSQHRIAGTDTIDDPDGEGWHMTDPLLTVMHQAA